MREEHQRLRVTLTNEAQDRHQSWASPLTHSLLAGRGAVIRRESDSPACGPPAPGTSAVEPDFQANAEEETHLGRSVTSPGYDNRVWRDLERLRREAESLQVEGEEIGHWGSADRTNELTLALTSDVRNRTRAPSTCSATRPVVVQDDKATAPRWRKTVHQTSIGKHTAFERTDGRVVYWTRYFGLSGAWVLAGHLPELRLEADSSATDPGPLLAQVDATEPLPAPPPRCPQVWVFVGNGDGSARTVVAEKPVSYRGGAATGWAVQFGGDAPLGSAGAWFGDALGATRPWPPRYGVLVAGPGAPWAPAVTPHDEDDE